MQECKFYLSKQTELGRIKLLELGNITFHDKSKNIVPKLAKGLEDHIHYVTIQFNILKNNKKSNRQSQ